MRLIPWDAGDLPTGIGDEARAAAGCCRSLLQGSQLEAGPGNWSAVPLAGALGVALRFLFGAYFWSTRLYSEVLWQQSG